MRDRIGLRELDRAANREGIGDVDPQAVLVRMMVGWNDEVSTLVERRDEMTADEPARARDEDAHRYTGASALSRWTSARTIRSTSCSNVTSGRQPSLAYAFRGSPTNKSTSAGR
jgi:hypothetical protein